MGKAVQYLLYGQIALWVSLLVSFLLLPKVVYDNQGISHFGVYAKTILPYGLGFLACGYLVLMAAHSISSTNHIMVTFRRALLLLAFFLLAVLLTPFSVSTLFDWSHMIVSWLLFMCELVFAAWLLCLQPNRVSWLLFVAQCAGSALAAFSLLSTAELMFTGQLVAEVAFGILLVRAAAYLPQAEA